MLIQEALKFVVNIYPVIAVGALFSIFAPDPTLEQKIVMVEEAKVNQSEEDEQAEP